MKYLIIAFAVLSIVVLILACKSGPSLEAIPNNSYLVDVRTVSEFESGSVPSADNIPLSEIENNIDRFRNKENIVLFCRSGNRSGKALKILESQGIKNVFNGGSWQQVNALLVGKE